MFGYGPSYFTAISQVLQYLVICLLAVLFLFTVMTIKFSLTWERLWLEAQGSLTARAASLTEEQQELPVLKKDGWYTNMG